MLQQRTSLAKKLFLGAGLVLFVAILAPWLYMDHYVTQKLQTEGEDRARLQLELIVFITSPSTIRTLDQAKKNLQEFVRLSGSNITLLTDKGEVLADYAWHDETSQVRDVVRAPKAGGAGSSLTYWPEIDAAVRGERVVAYRSAHYNKQGVFYTATQVAMPDGKTFIVRVGVPSSAASAELKRLEYHSIIITAIIFALAMLTAYVWSRHFARSIYKLAETALTIGHGHFDMRINHYPGSEFSGLAEAVNTMAANITTQMRTISERNRQLQATLDGLWEGVMALDRNGKIQATNQAFRKIAGHHDEDILGRTPIEVILDADLQENCRMVLAQPEKYTDKPKTMYVHIEDEAYEVHIVPWQNEGQLQGAIVVFHDISEIKRLEQVRQDFLANITHELRTPLTSIKGYAETMFGALPDDDNKKSAGVILKNADRMIRLIEDALILSGLESGRQPLNLDEVDLPMVLSEAWKECSSLAEKKDMKVHFKINPGPHEAAVIKGDRHRLQQVFRNIMENAIKYNHPDGVIEVEVALNDTQATISITDDGPGIPFRDRRRIFERFYRVEAHRGRLAESRGTGLGLSISKHIIDMHQGHIWVESPPPGLDQGSVFRVRLNIDGPDA